MKTLILTLAILVTGCSSVPLKVELMPAPDLITQKCPELQIIDEKTVSLAKLMETVTRNYGKYHECALLHSSMVEWYERYRTIINGVQ